MKKYVSLHVVAASNSATFLDKLNEAVGHFQDSGLEVEIQYSTTPTQLTALVCAYKIF